MNNYQFLLRLITLIFGFSAIITSISFYLQLKKPLALHFAGFLLGAFTLFFGEFISFLSIYIDGMWFAEGSYLFYVISSPAYLIFSFFGVSFTYSLRGKKVSLIKKALLLLPLITLTTLEELNIIHENLLIIPLFLTTLYMLIRITILYRDLSEGFIKKAIKLFFIQTLITLPFMLFIYLRILVDLSLIVIYVHLLVVSIESQYFAFKYLSQKPFLEKGSITEHFIKKYNLTTRETQVTSLLLKGVKNSDIADELSISLRTVTTHISNIYNKVSVKNKIQLLNLFNGNWC